MNQLNQDNLIKRTFYRAIVFMLIAGIVQSMQEMLLDFFISRHIGSDGLAAFGIVYPLISLIMTLVAWIVAGVQAICARDIGNKDYGSAQRHLGAGLTWGVLILTAYSIICWISHYPLITVLGATDDYAHLRGASTDALLIGSIGGPFLCALIILMTNLFFYGKRKQVAILVIITIVVEIMITAAASEAFPTMKGIWGGYVIGLVASNVIIQLYLRITDQDPDSMFHQIRPVFTFVEVKDSLKTGLPELLCWSYYVVCTALRNGLIIRIGNENDLAAVTLRDGVEFGELLQTAVFYAVLVTIGMAYGSHDRENYRNHIRIVAKGVLKIACIGGIVQMLYAWPILKLFVNEGESKTVFDITFKILLIYGFYFIFYLINNMFSSLYETIGKLYYAHLNYFLEAILYVVFMLVLGRIIGIDGIWIAQPVSEIILLFINLCLAWRCCGHFPRHFVDLSFEDN